MKEATLQAKSAVVEEIKDNLDKAQSVVIIDYRGLTVEEVTKLRNDMRAKGAVYKVLKNTMIKRAADDLGIEGMDDMLEGPTAVAFGIEDAVAPAKVIVDFMKANKDKITIKGGLLDNKVIGLDQIKYLADLPSKEVLIAKLLGSLNAPVTNFVGVLAGVPRAFVCALNAIKEQKDA